VALAAGLDDVGDERFEQDFVILLFFVLQASPRVADSAPPLIFDDSLPDEDRLLELPDSLPFSAATANYNNSQNSHAAPHCTEICTLP